MMRHLVCVPGTGITEELKLIVGEIEYDATQLASVLCSPETVAEVGALVDTMRVVENGEKLDDLDICPRDLGEPHPVLEHSCPMSDAVRAIPGQCVVFEDRVDEKLEVVRHIDLRVALAVFYPVDHLIGRIGGAISQGNPMPETKGDKLYVELSATRHRRTGI